MDIVSLLTEKISSLGVKDPAVCISGGIDSTVILHHVIHDLMDGDGSKVRTFTATFGNGKDETEKARRIAAHYGTEHIEVPVDREEFFSGLPLILRHYPFPRYNVWTWFVIREIFGYTRTLFIGEGGDELFGYPDRSYLEGWAGQLIYVWPAWKVPCDFFGVNLHAPFKEIQYRSDPVTDFLKQPDKELLRDAYTNILPDFVISQKSTPPSHGFYEMVGMTREQLQVEACKAWLEQHQ